MGVTICAGRVSPSCAGSTRPGGGSSPSEPGSGILTASGACYQARQWVAPCAAAAVNHKRTRPYRPQTDGKIERFRRTLLLEWAYVRPYPSERSRVRALAVAAHLQPSQLPHLVPQVADLGEYLVERDLGVDLGCGERPAVGLSSARDQARC